MPGILSLVLVLKLFLYIFQYDSWYAKRDEKRIDEPLSMKNNQAMAAPALSNLFEAHTNIVANGYLLPAHQLKSGSIFFSPCISDPDWNFLWLSHAQIMQDEIEIAQQLFRERGRTFSVYLPEDLVTEKIKDRCGVSKKAFEDVWFWAPLDKLPQCAEHRHLKLCETEVDQQLFLKAFEDSYSGANEKEAYGALDQSYIEGWKLAFATPDQISPYLIVDGAQTLGCLAIGKYQDLVGLYGIGIIPSARGRWLWKRAAEEALSIAKHDGAKSVFAITEAGSANEKLYRRCGMNIVGRASGWI